MKKFTLILAGCIIWVLTFSQVAPDKYWVKFTDKNNSTYSISHPEQFLTQRAIDRRNAQGIAIAVNDLPVNSAYIQAVATTGATLLNVSKWFNSVTIYTTSPAVLSAINLLPFVLSVEKLPTPIVSQQKQVKPFFDNEIWDEPLKEDIAEGPTSGESFSYGMAYNQINMLNGIAMHNLGYDGTGMVIAILDAGFLNANTIPAFDSLWDHNKILGTKDFVSPLSPDIFGSHTHGTMVLSTMGANLPGLMVGTAPHADFWLLRSEDGDSEYIIEELNWASAAEFADSVGADVINSSLGYTTFSDPTQDHNYQDMDGNSTPITTAADLAASKGMLVVNSSGNDGNSSWHYIGAPADGDSVFSIGAVTASGNYASFSSVGPTYDGRIKPNVVAQGSASAVINPNTGNVTTGSGTSFSSPITAGMVACLWQAHPNKRNMEIMEAIQQTASLATNPNYQLGYGIPNYFNAHTLLNVPVNYNFSIQIKVFLEGPYNGIDMNTELNSMLPLTQPYHVSPFNYNGTESVSSIPGSDIVDWILVELRDASDADLAIPATTLSRKAAFLKSDGTIVNMDGSSNLQFNVTVSENLYLVIRHRNHLGIMSSWGLQVISNHSSYDFTTGSSKVLGLESGYKELAADIWGMVAGDGNADGIIDQSDKLAEWKIDAGLQGYLVTDYNLNGQVSNEDKNEYWLPNLGSASQLP
jgi:serine protease AprX